jgi:2-oxo-4-hydroxy-4-carboxy--5-ureidoimidazoline (OHCU) decarboxylase
VLTLAADPFGREMTVAAHPDLARKIADRVLPE